MELCDDEVTCGWAPRQPGTIRMHGFESGLGGLWPMAVVFSGSLINFRQLFLVQEYEGMFVKPHLLGNPKPTVPELRDIRRYKIRHHRCGRPDATGYAISPCLGRAP